MKYEPELLDRIYELFATGDYSVEHICRLVGISEAIFYRWKNDPEKVEFLEGIKNAQAKRLEAFKNMARSGLAKRLDVFTAEESKVITKNMPHKVKLKHPDGTIEERTEYRPIKLEETKIAKTFLPSDTLIMYVLNNQDTENFKHVQHIEHKNIPTGRTIMDTPDEEPAEE